MADKVYTCIGARNFAKTDRQKEDFYATDPKAIHLLCGVEKFNSNILEPCCGQGHMAEVLKSYQYSVASSDLYDRGYGEVKNFFGMAHWDGDIITNPPYKNALDFVKHSLDIVNEGAKVAMLLRTLFLEGKERGKWLVENPPKYIYVFSGRISCYKDGDFLNIKGNGAISFSWFVWEKGYKGEPKVRWLNYD